MAKNVVELSHDYDPDTKESYGNTDRLSPDEARRFINDLVRNMRHRAWELAHEDNDIIRHNRDPADDQADLSSEQKQLYGDSWTLLYGIMMGINLMRDEHVESFDREEGEVIDHGISGDDSWQDHYDEYGYGPYGRGLKIGKRLAFYEDRDFTFSNGEGLDGDDSQSSSEKFTFIGVDDG